MGDARQGHETVDRGPEIRTGRLYLLLPRPRLISQRSRTNSPSRIGIELPRSRPRACTHRQKNSVADDGTSNGQSATKHQTPALFLDPSFASCEHWRIPATPASCALPPRQRIPRRACHSLPGSQACRRRNRQLPALAPSSSNVETLNTNRRPRITIHRPTWPIARGPHRRRASRRNPRSQPPSRRCCRRSTSTLSPPRLAFPRWTFPPSLSKPRCASSRT